MVAGKLYRADIDHEELAREQASEADVGAGKTKALIDSSRDMVSFFSADQTTPIAISIDQV